jgi:hypothetical protein
MVSYRMFMKHVTCDVKTDTELKINSEPQSFPTVLMKPNRGGRGVKRKPFDKCMFMFFLFL